MVSIDQIKELRALTGISMTACKKALEESGGDIDKAVELLRKKGEAKAVERSGRDAGEGTIAVASADGKRAMVLLACETDFVAKSDEFVEAANDFAKRVLAEGVDIDLSQEVADLGIKLGEKIELRQKVLVEGAVTGNYIHSNGKIGVVVSLEGGSEDLAKDVAMHAAATNPLVLSPDEVDSSLVEKERGIWQEQLRQEGKPEQIWDKIIEGKEKKFREEGALVTQPFVKNPDQSVADYLGDAKVVEFVAFRV